MKWLILGCLAWAVCACAAPDNTPQGVCARSAEDDPDVRELVMLSGTNTELLLANRERLKIARAKATNRCLAAKGLEPPGGVESPNLPK